MYDQLCSLDNLLLAYRKAAKGKRGHPNVAAFEYRLEDHLLQLRHELETKTFQPGTYHSFYIHEPKRRLISAAPFRDRVVHHALCNLMEPIFERSFISDSYANRKHKGISFLGFCVFPSHRLLKARVGLAFRRRLRDLTQRYADGHVSFEQIGSTVNGWLNHVRYGDTMGLRRAVLRDVMLQREEKE